MRHIGLWLEHDGLWLEGTDGKVQITAREVPGQDQGKGESYFFVFLEVQRCVLHSGGEKEERTLTLPSKS